MRLPSNDIDLDTNIDIDIDINIDIDIDIVNRYRLEQRVCATTAAES